MKLPKNLKEMAVKLFTRPVKPEHFELHPNFKQYLEKNRILIPGWLTGHEKTWKNINMNLGTGFADEMEQALKTKNTMVIEANTKKLKDLYHNPSRKPNTLF